MDFASYNNRGQYGEALFSWPQSTIAEKIKKESGGAFSKILDELLMSDFIQFTPQMDSKKTNFYHSSNPVRGEWTFYSSFDKESRPRCERSETLILVIFSDCWSSKCAGSDNKGHIKDIGFWSPVRSNKTQRIISIELGNQIVVTISRG
jgi:hypothetical protein